MGRHDTRQQIACRLFDAIRVNRSRATATAAAAATIALAEQEGQQEDPGGQPVACIGRGCGRWRHGSAAGTVVAGLVVRHCLIRILRRGELFVAFFIFNTRLFGFYYTTI